MATPPTIELDIRKSFPMGPTLRNRRIGLVFQSFQLLARRSISSGLSVTDGGDARLAFPASGGVPGGMMRAT